MLLGRSLRRVSQKRNASSFSTSARCLSLTPSRPFPRTNPPSTSERSFSIPLKDLSKLSTRPHRRTIESSRSSPPHRVSQLPLLPPAWVQQHLRTPASSSSSDNRLLASSPPPSPPPASPPHPPPESSSESEPPLVGLEETHGASSSSDLVPSSPPPPNLSLPTEENLAVIQASVVDALHVSKRLHSASQHEGMNAALEPVVGVYCPLEGGTYVLDVAIEEVASRVGAELVTLDAIELAAEGKGSLGPATSVIPLSPNPLKLDRADASSVATTTASTSSLWDAPRDMGQSMEDDAFDEDLDVDEEEDDLEDVGPPDNNDHTVSSSSASRSSDWQNVPAVVLDPPQKASSSTSGLSDEPPHPDFLSPFLPARDRFSRKGHASADPKEILARLCGEIVNAEPRTPASSSSSSSSSPDSSADALPGQQQIDPVSSLPKEDASTTALTSTSSPSRIIYIKNAIPLSETMSSDDTSRPNWFAELREAVQTRRRDVGPTIIVLGLTPSVMPPPKSSQLQNPFWAGHPAPRGPLWTRPIPGLTRAEQDAVLDERIQKALKGQWGSLIPPFEGGGNSSHGGGGKLSSLLGNLGLPVPTPLGKAGGVMMMLGAGPPGRLGGGGSDGKGGVAGKTLWKVVAVLPRSRQIHLEQQARERTIARINELLFRMGASTSQAVLQGPLPSDNSPQSEEAAEASEARDSVQASIDQALRESGIQRKADPSADDLDRRFRTSVISWEEVVSLSGIAAGIAQFNAPIPVSPSTSVSEESAESSKSPPRPVAVHVSPREVPITWALLRRAYESLNSSAAALRAFHAETVKNSSPGGNDSKQSDNGEKVDPAQDGVLEPHQQPQDEVIAALKKDTTLNKYEKKILHTIVDARAIPDSFNDVHLPDKTIDAIRSVVSLPLLFPEAFSTGILKNHSTTGALLFGPPGTGKTLLVRALAKDSGARMMSIQPSDVMDMYFGEAEKLVKAVFSIARRLAPCIVFIDELDALFQSRTGGGSSGGDSARRQMLTEFMQEMDGLNSASQNRKKGLVVIGATNRPQDLDEAVLRRLPRRLLIDLPGEKEREAILKLLLRTEKLGPDVDLAAIAKQTATYSGSDLKHLCVLAAQEAVKELYEVPWAKKLSGSSTQSSPLLSSSSSDENSPPVVPIVEEAASHNITPGTEAMPKEAKPQPVTEGGATDITDAVCMGLESSSSSATSSSFSSSSSSAPSFPSSSSSSSSSSASALAVNIPVSLTSDGKPDLAALNATITLASNAARKAVLDAVARARALGQDLPDEATLDAIGREAAAKAVQAQKGGGESAPAEETSTDGREKGETKAKAGGPKERVLMKKHFDAAFTNSSSSGSEELGALPELRKWNEQFGDAGTKKNKKSGFGAGRFGFGGEQKAKADGGGETTKDGAA